MCVCFFLGEYRHLFFPTSSGMFRNIRTHYIYIYLCVCARVCAFMVEHAKILLWRPSFETILADSPAKPVCVEFQNQMRSSSMARNRVRKFVSEALIRCRAAAKSRIVSAEMHSSPNACFSCELKKP